MRRTISRTVQIEMTPEEVAKGFAHMNSTEQAIFFNKLAELVADWGAPFCMQMEYIIDNELSDGARSIMEDIGSYARERRP